MSFLLLCTANLNLISCKKCVDKILQNSVSFDNQVIFCALLEASKKYLTVLVRVVILQQI